MMLGITKSFDNETNERSVFVFLVPREQRNYKSARQMFRYGSSTNTLLQSFPCSDPNFISS